MQRKVNDDTLVFLKLQAHFDHLMSMLSCLYNSKLTQCNLDDSEWWEIN